MTGTVHHLASLTDNQTNKLVMVLPPAAAICADLEI